MKNQEKTVFNRVLRKQQFKNAEEAIKGGEETGSLKNPELVKGLIEGYKGKTVEAPVEVIMTSAIFLNRLESRFPCRILACGMPRCLRTNLPL